MRSDLGWSYLTGGAMNTVNAAGYLVGALLAPACLRRFHARPVLVVSALLTSLLLALHGARCVASLHAPPRLSLRRDRNRRAARQTRL